MNEPKEPLSVLLTMEKLRSENWCVVLKCMPEKAKWIIEGSKSEYDAPCPDTHFSARWVCEASDMGYAGEATSIYRGSFFSSGESAYDAISALLYKINDAKR